MRFIDLNDNGVVTVAGLFDEWVDGLQCEPENHQPSFQLEMIEIILATVNGRNDLVIDGLTGKEVERLIKRLRKGAKA